MNPSTPMQIHFFTSNLKNIMAKVSTYLNFSGNTEEAFNFYKSIFDSEFMGEMMRYGDVPPGQSDMQVPEQDKNLVMHVTLPIMGDHYLMGTDITASMAYNVTPGNNMYLALDPDTKEETDRLFKALSEGGKVETEMQDMFWGDYYGVCVDKFGIKWMFNHTKK